VGRARDLSDCRLDDLSHGRKTCWKGTNAHLPVRTVTAPFRTFAELGRDWALVCEDAFWTCTRSALISWPRTLIFKFKSCPQSRLSVTVQYMRVLSAIGTARGNSLALRSKSKNGFTSRFPTRTRVLCALATVVCFRYFLLFVFHATPAKIFKRAGQPHFFIVSLSLVFGASPFVSLVSC